jgi:hypothetical protein
MYAIINGEQGDLVPLEALLGADTEFRIAFMDGDGLPVDITLPARGELDIYSDEERTNRVARLLVTAVDAPGGYGTAELPDDETLDGVGTYYLYGRWSDGTGTVTAVLITAAGTNLTVHPTLALSGGNGTGATATAKVGVASATVAAGGTGYVTGDVIEHNDPGGTGSPNARFVVTASGGVVTGLTVQVAGVYTGIVAGDVSATATTAITGTGTGCTVNTQWKIVETTVTAPGSGYTDPPDVAVTPATFDGTLAAEVSDNDRQISLIGTPLTFK